MKMLNYWLCLVLLALGVLILLCCPIVAFNIFAGCFCVAAGLFNGFCYLRK